MIIKKIKKSFRRLKRHFFFKRPANHLDKIWFELVGACNLHCALCPVTIAPIKKKGGLAKMETFLKALEATNPKEVEFCIWGEPLLHPKTADFLRVCYERNIKVYISSNFNVNVDFDKLYEANPKMELVFSCYGMSEDTYKIYHRDGDFNLVMENVKKANQARKKYDGSLGWVWMRHRYNQEELEKCLKFCEDYDIDPIVSEIIIEPRREILEPLSCYKENLHWASTDSRYFKKKKKKKRCTLPFNTTCFDFDGTVYPCCSTYDKEYSFGNILEDSWKEIWNGPKYNAARKAILRKRFGDLSIICQRCAKKGFRDF